MKARYWHPDGRGRFVCELCPRQCALKPGQAGFCFVREASDEGIELKAYGRSSGFCVDPIEKKPLHHFYPGSTVYSFGTVGCNLGCKYCQNWDISKERSEERLQAWASPKHIAQSAQARGCRSVAFTYNEPVIFAEYAIEVAHECRRLGIQTVAVSSGYISETARAEFFGAMDAANIDLKSFSEEFYSKVCLGHLQPVLETLEYLAKLTQVWLEVTTLLIPGLNDSAREIEALTRWVADHLGEGVPLHFSAFHPDFKMRELPRTPRESLLRAREIALKNGLRYVYVGNLPVSDAAHTYCPKCKALLIERSGYVIGTNRISHGKCPLCSAQIAGRFC